MSVGDRIVIGNSYTFKPESGESVMVYGIKLNPDGSPDMAPDGSVGIIALGGCKIGSSGTINGPIVKTHRSYLHNGSDYIKGIGGNDFVNMIPIFLDTYQKVAYLPVDHIRLYGGFTN